MSIRSRDEDYRAEQAHKLEVWRHRLRVERDRIISDIGSLEASSIDFDASYGRTKDLVAELDDITEALTHADENLDVLRPSSAQVLFSEKEPLKMEGVNN